MEEGCIGVVLVIVAVIAYCALVVAFFVYAVPVIAGLGGIAAIGLMLYTHSEVLLATIRKTPREQEGKEPAVKQYFYSTAWHELSLAIKNANDEALRYCRMAFGHEMLLLAREPKLATMPLGIGLIVATAASALVGYVIFGVGITLHAAILSVCFLVLLSVVGVLRAAELVSMAVRRIYLVCPNRDCHRRISLPVYRCPSCGAVHKSLLPGSYGAFKRRCECESFLPTLFLLGRRRIPAFCPHASCGKPLSEAIGSARNIHIPVVGGPYVGKTAFLTATMLEIKRRSEAEMSFPERSDELAFEAASQRFARGMTVDKTAGASPNAMLVRVEDTRQGQSLLYIYDAAGELYAGMAELRRQNFFTHAHAVALLVDPFSMEHVRTNYARELATFGPEIRASNEIPQNVYDRLVMTLREQRGDGRVAVPLAIVITKVDAIGIESEITALAKALTAAAPPNEKNPPDAVREWLLRHGEGNLVRSAERDFRRVRYFACSALGRMPSPASAGAFVSRGVLAPFQWLAETNGVRLA